MIAKNISAPMSSRILLGGSLGASSRVDRAARGAAAAVGRRNALPATADRCQLLALWEAVCAHLMPHDFRRDAVRTLVNARVPETARCEETSSDWPLLSVKSVPLRAIRG